MTDVHSVAARSRNMAAIRGQDTKPELILRRALFAKGFRYRLHDRKLPGRPDLVLPKYHAVIFVHGCFFHGHECPTFRWPATREQFWRQKIEGNRVRDEKVARTLREAGWRVLTVWECMLRGRGKLPPDDVAARVEKWLSGVGSAHTIGDELRSRR
jgi:DNA mismatch endonuclease (patch repair protein)